MSILIVAATLSEVKLPPELLGKKDIHLLITGVGSVPAMYAILKAVLRFNPQTMIQTGIAGSFEKEFNPGSVVAVSKDSYGDLGVMEQKIWTSVFDMGFEDPNKRPYKNGWLTNPNKRLMKECHLPFVSATTVNEITTNKHRAKLLKNEGIVVESMEGAAFHYIGIMEKIPFIQLRGISNYVGERDKKKWNIKEAVSNVNHELIKLINKIQSAK